MLVEQGYGMPVSVSTDLVRPSERQAFWTEAICRSFASVDTRPLRAGAISGHFEAFEFGNARVARFDTSPQSYSRNARLVSSAGRDDFMFDFQLGGRSCMIQGTREGAIQPGQGVLYDARRPFEDLLDSQSGQRAEVLMVTVPAGPFLQAFPDGERMCAIPISLGGAVARSIARLLSSLAGPAGKPQREGPGEYELVTYLVALLRCAAQNGGHGLSRHDLFALVDTHVRQSLAEAYCPAVIAALFGISERTLHRMFADRGTTFEKHLLRRRVERFRELLLQACVSHVSIANLAVACGFSDAAHASRTFKAWFQATPRDYRAAALCGRGDQRQP